MLIAERSEDLKCGIWMIDITDGRTVAFLEFQSGVEEIFDVRVLCALTFPAVIGFEKDTINGTFVVPPNSDVTTHHSKNVIHSTARKLKTTSSTR